METRRTKTRVVLSFLALVGLLWLSPLAMAVDIPDLNLRAAVNQALGNPDPTQEPTEAQMHTLGYLLSNNSNITDLTGLEYATYMYYLELNSNQISDVSPLSGLTNLTDLRLGSNQISNISPLSGLTNLTDLRLGSNQISNISALSGLTNMTFLDLGFNQISDISALSGMTNMTYLDLGFNQISDISALSGMTNMTDLRAPVNQISDISPLSGLTNMTVLDLRSNQISNISALSGMMNMTRLELDGNHQISDISALSGMTNMTYLMLGYNQISDISALSGMTNLTWLELFDNQISDISPLSGLTNLTWLMLFDNPLNCEAYSTYLPLIEANNPGINMTYDPKPPGCAPLLTCIGFEPPMDKTVSVKKKNRVLPLKMVFIDENGIEITDTDIVAPPVVEIDFTGGNPTEPPGEDFLSAGQGDEGNQFVYTGDSKWQFNLQTKNFSGAGTYTIRAVSGDPAEYDIEQPGCVAEFVILQ
jgi:Leucine-rich repeat (LRR) protein